MQLRNIFYPILISIIWLFSISSYADESSIVIDNNEDLIQIVTQLSEQNSELREKINSQKAQVMLINDEQNTISSQIMHVQNTLATLDEQGEWLSFSTALGDTLRQQLLRLPEKPKSQALDATIAESKVLQLSYNTTLDNLNDYPSLTNLSLDNIQLIQYRRLIREL